MFLLLAAEFRLLWLRERLAPRSDIFLSRGAKRGRLLVVKSWLSNIPITNYQMASSK
jgi:hypothetical protein